VPAFDLPKLRSSIIFLVNLLITRLFASHCVGRRCRLRGKKNQQVANSLNLRRTHFPQRDLQLQRKKTRQPKRVPQPGQRRRTLLKKTVEQTL
jgi:hypothetical protein